MSHPGAGRSQDDRRNDGLTRAAGAAEHADNLRNFWRNLPARHGRGRHALSLDPVNVSGHGLVQLARPLISHLGFPERRQIAGGDLLFHVLRALVRPLGFPHGRHLARGNFNVTWPLRRRGNRRWRAAGNEHGLDDDGRRGGPARHLRGGDRRWWAGRRRGFFLGVARRSSASQLLARGCGGFGSPGGELSVPERAFWFLSHAETAATSRTTRKVNSD